MFANYVGYSPGYIVNVSDFICDTYMHMYSPHMTIKYMAYVAQVCIL